MESKIVEFEITTWAKINFAIGRVFAYFFLTMFFILFSGVVPELAALFMFVLFVIPSLIGLYKGVSGWKLISKANVKSGKIEQWRKYLFNLGVVVIGNAIVFITIAVTIYIASNSQGNINGIGLFFGIAPSVIITTICYAHLPGITGVLKDITAPNNGG